MGDARFSVAVRTLVLSTSGTDGLRRGEPGTDPGIMHDSVADDEHTECQLKTRFMTTLDPGLSLSETMHATREGAPLLNWHLAWLEQLTAALGFPFGHTVLTNDVVRACATFESEGVHQIHLLLTPNGSVGVSAVPLSPLHADWDAPVHLLVTP